MAPFFTQLMNTLNVLLTLAEHYGLIVAAAFLLLSWSPLPKLIHKDTSLSEKVVLILFFGALGILGTYAGTPVRGAIANLRAIGVIAGGLLGGPLVGTAAGLIAGGHRMLMDIHGFTAASSALATLLEGLAAGLLSLRLKAAVLNWQVAFAAAFLGECLHMLLILSSTRPLAQGWMLVRVIALPMILVNSSGAALFVQMIHFVQRDRLRHAAIQARKALAIANETVSHLRSGLTPESAAASARIIFERTAVAAVAITDTARILALVGADRDHHPALEKIQARLTQKLIASAKPLFLNKKQMTAYRTDGCRPQSAIIVPLTKRGLTVGTLTFYGSRRCLLRSIDFQIALGLARLFSTQLELEDIQIQSELLACAEIKRLQSQINPHFLFNALNTIGSFCRTNSEKARQLILELSTYLRKNLDHGDHFVSLAEELQQVRSYLSIAQARFGDRIKAFIDVQKGCEDWPIPPLVIQPLVENAVQHGIGGLESGGAVWIEAKQRNGLLQVLVSDNGVGMPADPTGTSFRQTEGEGGIGLANIRQRLAHIYGPGCRLKVNGRPKRGTTVRLSIPGRPALPRKRQTAVTIPKGNDAGRQNAGRPHQDAVPTVIPTADGGHLAADQQPLVFIQPT